MFGRERERATTPTEEPTPPHRRAAKAAADGAITLVLRLVSLGAIEFAQRDLRTGEVAFRPATLYVDLDHPMNRYVEIDSVPGLHALHSTSGPEDRTTPVPGNNRYQRWGRPSSVREPSPPAAPA